MLHVLQGSAASSHGDRYVLEGATIDEILLAANLLLVKHGFVVAMPGEWESPAEFRVRLGISRSHFQRRMRQTKFRPQVDLDVGPTGRLLRIRSNAVFDKWMLGTSRRQKSAS